MGKRGGKGPSFWNTLDRPCVPWNIPVNPKTHGGGSVTILIL